MYKRFHSQVARLNQNHDPAVKWFTNWGSNTRSDTGRVALVYKTTYMNFSSPICETGKIHFSSGFVRTKIK